MAPSFKGVISDSMCGAKHVDASEESTACVKKCVKDGDEAVFITSDNKVLTIDKASQEKAAPHLGQQGHDHWFGDRWKPENRFHQDVKSVRNDGAVRRPRLPQVPLLLLLSRHPSRNSLYF
jgi:hypothetical protein